MLPSSPSFIGIWQDGHPPLGWHDTAAYLVLPVLLVLSQYVSMEIMKPPQVRTYLFYYIYYNSYSLYFKKIIFPLSSKTLLFLTDWWSSSEKHSSCLQVPSADDRILFFICPIGVIDLLVSLLFFVYHHLHYLP